MGKSSLLLHVSIKSLGDALALRLVSVHLGSAFALSTRLEREYRCKKSSERCPAKLREDYPKDDPWSIFTLLRTSRDVHATIG